MCVFKREEKTTRFLHTQQLLTGGIVVRMELVRSNLSKQDGAVANETTVGCV